jgi:hypothetical protein
MLCVVIIFLISNVKSMSNFKIKKLIFELCILFGI